jgi:hypothetical protein
VGSGLVAVDARGVVGFGDVVDAIDALGSQRRVDRDREETRAKEEDEVKGMHSLSTATKAPDLVPQRGAIVLQRAFYTCTHFSALRTCHTRSFMNGGVRGVLHE